MKHRIIYINRHLGYKAADLTSWECEVCHQGPFKPAVVCVGEGGDFRVVSGIMYWRDAGALKAKLNMNLNQATYYCLGYEEVLKIRGWGPKELIFDHPGTKCKEVH